MLEVEGVQKGSILVADEKVVVTPVDCLHFDSLRLFDDSLLAYFLCKPNVVFVHLVKKLSRIEIYHLVVHVVYLVCEFQFFFFFLTFFVLYLFSFGLFGLALFGLGFFFLNLLQLILFVIICNPTQLIHNPVEVEVGLSG